MHYRCFFLGEDDHIKAAEIIEADTIGEAIDTALVMLRERPQHRTVELWEGKRKLYRADEPWDRIGLTVAELSESRGVEESERPVTGGCAAKYRS
jgi:hypothetical protein